MYYKTVIFLSPNCFRTPRMGVLLFWDVHSKSPHPRRKHTKTYREASTSQKEADQLIGLVCRLLSISRIVVEETKFDLHKIQNPDVESIEYQQGPQYGFDNLETTFSYLTQRLFHPHHHIKSRLRPRACPWVTADKELCQPHG